MDFITIDSQSVPIEGEKNILSIIRKAGIDLPTFCYHSELSIYGACRMCVVEDDRGRVFASCSEQPRKGMVIKTNSSKIQKYRKLIMELLLSSHCRDCTTCHKNGICELQKLAYKVGVDAVRFTNNKETLPLDTSSPSIVRDPNKCILCGDCVRTCDEVQGVGALDFAFRGSEMQVMPAFNKPLAETNCVGCGQCRVVCPTGAITIKKDEERVWEALDDPNTRVVAQIAPAVRVAIGDSFGIPKGTNSMGKLVGALRRMGFDKVYDTTFGADLTVYEESKELVERIQNNEKLPLFTSCCPGWVKFCENKFPELTDHISTCRSPQGMFSALLKDYYRTQDEKEGVDMKTFVVSIMPCTAKKGEAIRDDYKTDGVQDTDASITTAEAARMIRRAAIKFEDIEEEAVDMPFGIVSGGGVIFGVTGGVTEAVLRKISYDKDHNHKALGEIKFSGIRGIEGVKETSIMLGDREVKIAVVHGLGNASKLIEEIKAGKRNYDFVEVMACKRGCVMGGGQPVPAGPRTKQMRMKGLYSVDTASQVRTSNENPLVRLVYDDMINGREHKLLHTR
ncbi:NADH-quinone oxidoreductase subunit G [Aequitasia blattaphilus]|uniref:[FeFe] hydrogenase, group A n=1 Tax=Aequitasia blattaphilus TaxID=2949332 RepID=A0ABT1EAA9_9FIRM|nr:2Fe-2S iron-sulfur cluster binding domain-containing protein [Aequitasia blattaphilus]MCP1102758.1 [FeFe] hydrogenase, group A [Aequitasia blattaphilus]MCR8615398.1 [FeFe] hydrogenase, group A [Aequitasia blattaphilus]